VSHGRERKEYGKLKASRQTSKVTENLLEAGGLRNPCSIVARSSERFDQSKTIRWKV